MPRSTRPAGDVAGQRRDFRRGRRPDQDRQRPADLCRPNTYDGGTTLSAGQLNINYGGIDATASALGTGTLTINGGTLGNTSGGAVTLATNNPQNWNGDFAFAGPNDLNLGTGPVTMNANCNVAVNAGNLTVGGAISGGAYVLAKAGTGTAHPCRRWLHRRHHHHRRNPGPLRPLT